MNEQTPPSSNKNLMAGVALFAVILILTVGVISMQKQPDQPTASPSAATTTTTTEETATNATFKSGVYTVQGNYTSPGGPESIGVQLTLDGNTVTDVVVTPNAVLPASVKFQGIVASEVKALVVGKNINDIKLDKISGSSLTPKGFNDAIEKVKREAQVS